MIEDIRSKVTFPLQEWEPKVGERVVDLRRDSEGVTGTVVRCDRYGHFADPYWRAAVSWGEAGAGGYPEHNISTVWLAREGDFSQGPRG